MPAIDTEILIHIEWDGPCKLDEVRLLVGPADYGVYQIYGGHPVYGSAALLYIGLAAARYFGVRISQETQWLDNRDAGRVEVYVGRLAGSVTPDDDTWDKPYSIGRKAADLRPRSPDEYSKKPQNSRARTSRGTRVKLGPTS